MQITFIRVYPKNEEKLKAFVEITFDHCFVVKHVRIVKTFRGYLVAMPGARLGDGTHTDYAHPINREFRHELEEAVMKAYEPFK